MATDRYGAWSRVRERGAVYEMGGHWFVTSSAAVRHVTRTPEVFSSAMHGDTLNAPTPYIPGGIDPPEHLAYRQVIDRRFAPKVLAALEEPLRVRFNELVDAFIDTGGCDVVPAIAEVFPAEIFMWIRLSHFLRSWTRFLSRKKVDNWAMQAKAERGGASIGHWTPFILLAAALVAMAIIWNMLGPVVQSSILWIGWPIVGVVTVLQTLLMFSKLLRRYQGYKV